MRDQWTAISGAVLVAAGAAGLAYAYSGSGFMAGLAAWAALLVGAFLLIRGISGFFATFMAPQRSVESGYGEAETRLFIQSLAAMASADGKIAAEEVAVIASIHERMLGLAIAPAKVEAVLAGLTGSFNITQALEKERDRLSPLLRERIVKSCFLVMMSDRVEETAETGKIHEIGRALGFSAEETEDLIAMAGV
jgi:tellurite resistance protein